MCMFVIVAKQITPEVLRAVEDFHLLNRSKEEIPILEGERDNMIRVLSEYPSNHPNMSHLEQYQFMNNQVT